MARPKKINFSKYEIICEKTAMATEYASIDGYHVSQAQQAWEIAKALRIDKRIKEYFYIICLDSALHVTGVHEISCSSLDATSVDMKVVFTAVLHTPRTAALIAMHNHPSGRTNPSQPDIDLTKRLQECASLLGYQLTDHVIVAENTFTSLRSLGYIY